MITTDTALGTRVRHIRTGRVGVLSRVDPAHGVWADQVAVVDLPLTDPVWTAGANIWQGDLSEWEVAHDLEDLHFRTASTGKVHAAFIAAKGWEIQAILPICYPNRGGGIRGSQTRSEITCDRCPSRSFVTDRTAS